MVGEAINLGDDVEFDVEIEDGELTAYELVVDEVTVVDRLLVGRLETTVGV